MPKPFASTADIDAPPQVVEEIDDGVWALTAGGDPTLGAIEAEDFVVCWEAGATPVVAAEWLETLRERTDKPVRYLVLSHYHAVRTLGAAAFDAEVTVTSEITADLIAERGQQDWDSEFGRMPRLFRGHEQIPGLTRPTLTFSKRLTIERGARLGRIELMWLGRGHTAGDIVAWLPEQRVLFAGDLVESKAALYTGDAYHLEWPETLERIRALDARALVGGRGAVVYDDAVDDAIDQTASFLRTLRDSVSPIVERGGSRKEAFQAAHSALVADYGQWPIFEHCLPFDVARICDELAGAQPRVWTADRDREIWDELQD